MALLHSDATLGMEGLREQVALPRGASCDEWLALKTREICDELSLLSGAFDHVCTDSSCPKMCAGPLEYRWADGVSYTQATRMPAPRYVGHLLSWVDFHLADETFCPVQPGTPFPDGYMKELRGQYKMLFRIFAHLAHSHGKEIVAEACDAHFKFCFTHFMLTVREFDLVEDSELAPLVDLIAQCLEQVRPCRA